MNSARVPAPNVERSSLTKQVQRTIYRTDWSVRYGRLSKSASNPSPS
jgi:hypothetical protein